jgi:DNA-directed RNA polymerase III subunit RPC1
MNIHVPQTYEARSETINLMGVRENIITPKSGESIVALIQDFLTTAFLLTNKDNFFTREQFSQIVSSFGDAAELISLPPPSIIKPVALWTGKQAISVLLRPNRKVRIIVNLKSKEKIYTKGDVMCLKDGFVVFKNSELLAGQLGKSTLGGNKSGLIYTLLRDNNKESACEVMHRFSKLSSRWLTNFGMTIGISDVTPSAELEALNKNVIEESFK